MSRRGTCSCIWHTTQQFFCEASLAFEEAAAKSGSCIKPYALSRSLIKTQGFRNQVSILALGVSGFRDVGSRQFGTQPKQRNHRKPSPDPKGCRIMHLFMGVGPLFCTFWGGAFAQEEHSSHEHAHGPTPLGRPCVGFFCLASRSHGVTSARFRV